MPIVSVIIPTYRHRDYVLHTLDSVFAQTFTDYEVIVVNDGSPDDTAQVLLPLVESRRIRYVAQANQGQAAARNHGLSLAKGEFAAFLDDDDLWPLDKLQWQVDELRRHPEAGAIAGSALIIDPACNEIERFHQTGQPITVESLFIGNPIHSLGQVLIRTEILRKVGGFDSAIWGTDDYQLWFDLVRNSTFLTKDIVALRYRQHQGNASNNYRRMLKNSCIVVDKELKTLPPSERGFYRAQHDKFLREAIGKHLVMQLKNRIKSRQIKASMRSLVAMAFFMRRVSRTPPVAWRSMRDLLPARFYNR
jgi:glycosyltransferase involved in cell wall biosynthesis